MTCGVRRFHRGCLREVDFQQSSFGTGFLRSEKQRSQRPPGSWPSTQRDGCDLHHLSQSTHAAWCVCILLTEANACRWLRERNRFIAQVDWSLLRIYCCCRFVERRGCSSLSPPFPCFLLFACRYSCQPCVVYSTTEFRHIYFPCLCLPNL